MSYISVSICAQKNNILTHNVSACSVCGQNHDTDDCSFIQNIHYVSDAPIISRARQTLPKNLDVINMADGSTTVTTKIELQKGTTFGPLCGRKISTMNPLTEFPIKVYGSESAETYYLDSSNENCSNWMCFVSPATSAKEQNLICHQVKQEIFYTAMRTISAGEELRVWYAPYYAFKMKMPLHNKSFAVYDNTTFPEAEEQQLMKLECTKQHKTDQAQLLSKESAEELAEKLPAQHLGAANDVEIWNCKFCLITTKSVVSYAKHLMEHYKPLLGIYCNICNKKCNNASVLKRHQKAKHAQSIVDGADTNLVKESQYQNSQTTFLLRVTDTESVVMDSKKTVSENDKAYRKINNNSVQVFSVMNDKEQKSSLSLLDGTVLNIGDLLQSDKCLNMNMGLNAVPESAIQENLVNPVKFNVEELVPELLDTVHEKLNNLDCDICDKKFDKVDYLYRHLRKHTGEFICPSCLIVFARKENLLSHACLSKNLEYKYECSFCQKLFMEKKYLKRHMAKHSEVIDCKWCHHVFSTVMERTAHKCSAPNYVCEECKKRFVHRAHLNRHIKLHSSPKFGTKRVRKRKEEPKPAICEKCGDTFRNPYSLKQHLHTHGERMFECDVCKSRFHRMAVLKEHKTIHQNAQVPCNICGKRLKSKKALDIHMLLHGNKKHQCDKCDKSFFQKCNYLKHYKHMHGDKITYSCPRCSMIFTNKQTLDKHIAYHDKPAEYSCALCKKSFHKEYQLKRHVQTSHSDIIYRCPFCHMTARHRHSMRRHFERQHNSLRQDWDKLGFVDQLAEKLPRFVIDEASIRQQDIPEERFADANSNDFKNIHVRQETPDFCSATDEAKNTQCVQRESESDKQTGNNNNATENEQVIALMESSESIPSRTIKNTELPLNEVPQLSINETSNSVNESVLRSAYIYDDEDGDIMFYVLQ